MLFIARKILKLSSFFCLFADIYGGGAAAAGGGVGGGDNGSHSFC